MKWKNFWREIVLYTQGNFASNVSLGYLTGYSVILCSDKLKIIDTPHALRKSGADTEVEYSYLEPGHEVRNICRLSGLADSQDFQSALKSCTLTSIHSKEQTLEDIVIELTERGLY